MMKTTSIRFTRPKNVYSLVSLIVKLVDLAVQTKFAIFINLRSMAGPGITNCAKSIKLSTYTFSHNKPYAHFCFAAIAHRGASLPEFAKYSLPYLHGIGSEKGHLAWRSLSH